MLFYSLIAKSVTNCKLFKGIILLYMYIDLILSLIIIAFAAFMAYDIRKSRLYESGNAKKMSCAKK